MELKDRASSNTSRAPEPLNPFNGIERYQEEVGGATGHSYTNPFNGIESGDTVGAGCNPYAWALNPFNGIERSNLSLTALTQSSALNESIQWN